MDTPEPIKDLIALQIYRHRRIWKPFMEKYDCRIIAEVGVFEGENFKRMIEHNPKIAIAIDMWAETGIVAQNDAGYPQEKLNQMYETFKAEMSNKPFVQIIRDYTFDAAIDFTDEYFDLVYIDADHTYEGCRKDLEAWYPKVRKGGYFTGDDYWNRTAPNTGVKFGVKRAVNEFAQKNNLIIYPLPYHGWATIK